MAEEKKEKRVRRTISLEEKIEKAEKRVNDCEKNLESVYMAFQKGTQTAPHGGIMPPQAGISTAGNGNSGCAGRRLTVAGHGGIMNPLLLMYKTGQRWRAT